MPDLDSHLNAIIAGDPDAFAAWVAGSEHRLRASLRTFAIHVDTEAVLQETLLRVWQVAPRFQSDHRPDGLLRLAIRIGRNLAVSELRRRRVRNDDVERLEREAAGRDDGASAWQPDPLLRALIARCREALSSKPARALQARLDAGGDEPDRDLAARVGMKLNTFLQNVTRARKQLADCLQRNGYELEGNAP